LAGTPAAGDAICIVRDHKARAAIVLTEDGLEQLRSACAEMQGRVQEATGAALEIVPTRPKDRVGIHVGRSAYVDALKFDLDGLDDDGFVIRFPDAGNIVILGPTPHGTEFGVYDFLERYVGVRWLMPGRNGTDVPKQATIQIPTNPLRDEPAFFSRLFSGLRGGAHVTWARRNRMHGRAKFHHNLIRLFPPETYTKSHPEFFPLRGGERFLPPTNSTHRWQPCFTAPGIVEEGIRNIVEYFNANPDAPSYSLGVNDSSGHCECENCRAADPGRKNFIGRDHLSDRYFTWTNQVVEGVLKTHPDKFFGCLAYSEIADPPDRVKIHERIIPYMTYDRMKWMHPDVRAKGEEATRAWRRQCPVLGWYDYIYGTPYCLPRVWFHHMGDYYRFGHKNGVRALYAEAYANFGEGPKLYVSLKLQWNPFRDVDELLGEWYERCVGADAARYLKEYYAHWEDFWTRRILDSPWFSERGQYLRFYSPAYLADVSPDEIAQSRRLLEMALAKTRTAKQRARAKLLLRAFEYYEASVLAYPRDALGGAPVDSDEKALRVIDDALLRITMNAKRRKLQLEEFAKHPVLVHPITMERRDTLRGDGWGLTDLWKAYDWVHRSPTVRRRLDQLANTSESGDVREQVQTMLDLIGGTGEDLLSNPSFEDGKGAAASDWSYWVKWGIGSMKRSKEVAHTGTFSILCDGMKRGGPHRTIPFQPGRYAAVCFVYVPEGQERSGTVALGITPRDAKHANIGRHVVTITPSPGRWQTIAVSAKIPPVVNRKEVAELLAIVIVDGFKPGEKVYIDDVTLLRIGDSDAKDIK